MNNLLALEKLKISAKQQSNELNNTITEIHKQNSKELLESLKVTHDKRSKNLEKSIELLSQKLELKTEKLSENIEEIHKNKLDTIVEMIEERLEQSNSSTIWLTAILSIIGTLAITLATIYFTINKQYQKENNRTAYYYIINHKEQ